jgi:hypothetical protein
MLNFITAIYLYFHCILSPGVGSAAAAAAVLVVVVVVVAVLVPLVKVRRIWLNLM